jgi:von Willebrand factor type A C-terminal domain
VAHYTGQAELAQAVQEGLSARKSGDVKTATAKLARAMELAVKSGNTGTAKLLTGVVEVDKKTGTVALRREVAAADEMALDARSTRTARVRKET